MANFKSGVSPSLESLCLEHLHEMDWKNFEILSRDYYAAKGYQASLTGAGADGGVDVILSRTHKSGKPLIVYIQCKAWSKKNVGVAPVRELFGVMASDSVSTGVFITASDFTADAKTFAKGKRLQLISGLGLLELIGKLPHQKQQQLTKTALSGDYKTPTCPSCDIKMVIRTTTKGKNKGEQFWGCSNFPACRLKLHKKCSDADWRPERQRIYEALSAKESPMGRGSKARNDEYSSIRAERVQSAPKKKNNGSPGRIVRAGLAALLLIGCFTLIANVLPWIITSFGTLLISQNQKVLEQHRKSAAPVNQEKEPASGRLRIGQKPSGLTPAQEAEIERMLTNSDVRANTEQQMVETRDVLKRDQRTQREALMRGEARRDKNMAWLAWYQQPKGCDNWLSDDHMVECTNRKMKAKKEFEKLWVQDKIAAAK